MKKSEDLSQAFLLKHFPGRHKMSSSVPSEVSRRNSVIVATTALILAILTSVILYKQTTAKLEKEHTIRIVLEQRLQEMENEADDQRNASRFAELHLAGFVKELKEWEAGAIKDEKIWLNRVIDSLEKSSLSARDEPKAPLTREKTPPEIAQGLPPWKTAE